MSTSVETLASQTRDAAAQLVARFLDSAEGQTLATLRESHRALTGIGFSLDELATMKSGKWATDDQLYRLALDRKHAELSQANHRKQSVKDKLLRLLEETRQPMTYEEVIAEYERRGDPIVAKSANASLRTAATHLIAEGKIHRPGYGVMRFGRDPAVGPSLFSDDNESKPVGDEKSLAREVAS